MEPSDNVKLQVQLFKAAEDLARNVAIVLVHPYTIIEGSWGLLQGIATSLTEKVYLAMTFDMHGVGKSSSRPSLTIFIEIQEVNVVCN